MEKEDARTPSREVLHEGRKQLIRMHRKGMPVMQIVEHSGLSGSAVSTAMTAYSILGVAALKPSVRGQKQGRGRLLSESQEHAVRQVIGDKRPEQMKGSCAHQGQAESGHNRTHANTGEITRACPEILSGCARKVCGVNHG